MNKITLTDDQKRVAKELEYFLEESEDDVFTLEGVAGTGKSTMLHEVLKNKSNIVAATVSHVAKSVLINTIGDIADCMTIAQLLNMKMSINEDGEIEFSPVIDINNPYFILPIENAEILVIDECSMVDEELHNLIIQHKNSKCKLIYLGDPFQLPPVKKDKSNIVDKDSITFDFTKSKLMKAIRYEGYIADLGTRIRDEIIKINNGKPGSKYLLNEWMSEKGHYRRTSLIDDKGNGIIFLDDIDSVINITKYHFYKTTDINELRLIAYRRKSIDLLNGVIRAQLFADKYGTKLEDGNIDLPQFVPNELVICDGGYNKIIHNNETFRVQSFTETIGPENIDCLSLQLEPQPLNQGTNHIFVVDENKGLNAYHEKLEELRELAKNDRRQWPNFYKYRDKFCKFEYSYAINTHRC